MSIFNKRDSFTVVGGAVLLHLVVFGWCGYLAYTFLIASYDPSVLPLIAAFVAAVIWIDVETHKVQAFSRGLVRFKTDADGIQCYGIGWKKWTIRWNEIHVFGTIGYTPNTGVGIIFLSTDRSEQYSRKQCILITPQRIVFQAEERIWEELSHSMPDDIKKKLWDAICAKRDCFYRR